MKSQTKPLRSLHQPLCRSYHQAVRFHVSCMFVNLSITSKPRARPSSTMNRKWLLSSGAPPVMSNVVTLGLFLITCKLGHNPISLTAPAAISRHEASHYITLRVFDKDRLHAFSRHWPTSMHRSAISLVTISFLRGEDSTWQWLQACSYMYHEAIVMLVYALWSYQAGLRSNGGGGGHVGFYLVAVQSDV